MADVFSDDNVERILSDHEGLHIRVEELDMLITESEVKKAISSLKKRKNPGADLLPPEVFIEGCEILSPCYADFLTTRNGPAQARVMMKSVLSSAEHGRCPHKY